MEWQIDSGAPIYSQLIDQVRYGIVSGMYPPGERLPSVRELATQAGVNPNTMQRALTELERSGLVFSQRTNGRFVTEDSAMINDAKITLAQEQARVFIDSMRRLGFMREQIVSIVEKKLGEEEKNADI